MSLELQLKKAYELHLHEKINDAEDIYLQILEKHPFNAQVLVLYGTLLLQTNRVDKSIPFLVKSIQSNPNIFIAHHNLGVCYSINNMFALALTYFNNSIKLNKTYHHTYREKGKVLVKLDRENEAIENFEQALRFFPNDDLSYIDLCLLYYFKRDYEKALLNNLKAIEFNGKSSYYFQIQGLIYLEITQYEKSEESFKKALSLDHTNHKAYLGLLKLYIKVDNNFEAKKISNVFFEKFPNEEPVMISLLNESIKECNWEGVYLRKKEFLKDIDNSIGTIHPFVFSSLWDDLLEIKNNTKNYIAQNFAQKPDKTFLSKESKKNNQKIKIGYFSSDFYNHATTILLSEVIRNHNHNDFYTIAFSYASTAKRDSDTQDYIHLFDQFIDIQDKTDYEASLVAKKYNLDVAVDLKGLTLNARPGILSHRVAPIQINFLGYPGTMSAPWIDYIVADKTIIPDKNYSFYDEKIIFMPQCYQPNRPIKPLKNLFLKKDFNLPEDSFIYCCFNDTYKITSEIFSSWMEILSKVDKSVLWLCEINHNIKFNLKKEAEKFNINEDRIIFSGKLSWEDHIERVSLADLFLDTFPYNAHTTASDCLRAQVPLLTLCGESFASRVASSLLHTLQLDDLITYNLEDYKKKAIFFSENKEVYAEIKNKLIDNIYSSVLYKPELFVKDLEAGYKEALNRFNAGLKLEHIFL